MPGLVPEGGQIVLRSRDAHGGALLPEPDSLERPRTIAALCRGPGAEHGLEGQAGHGTRGLGQLVFLPAPCRLMPFQLPIGDFGDVLHGQPPLAAQDDRVSSAKTGVCAGWRTGSSGRTAGAVSTSPVGAKREPWQGQSQLFSPSFQCTTQPRCGAHRRALVQRAVLVAVDGEQRAAAPHHGAAAGGDLVHRVAPVPAPPVTQSACWRPRPGSGARTRARRRAASCATGRRGRPTGCRGPGSGR